MEKYESAVSEKIETMWYKAMETADSFVSRSYLDKLNLCRAAEPAEEMLVSFPIELFRLTRLAYIPSEGIVDKLVNVYSSLNSIGTTVFTIIHGEPGKTEFYIGCLNRSSSDASRLLLESSFEGNFPGIELSLRNAREKDELLDCFFPLEYRSQSISSVSVSADFRKNKTEDGIKYIQGIEKFIDTMKGKEYTALFLAEPVSHDDCMDKKRACENMITELSKYNKIAVNYGQNDAVAVNTSLSEGTNESISSSINSSVSKSTSVSIGKNKGSSFSRSFSFFGTTYSSGKNRGTTENSTTGYADTTGSTKTNMTGSNFNKTTGESRNSGSSVGMTLNIENKAVSNIISKLEYELKKLENSDSFGLWDTAVYIVSQDSSTPIVAANSIRSLVIGDESGKAESFINYWDRTSKAFSHGSVGNIMKFLHYGMHPVFEKNNGISGKSFFFTPAVAVGGNVLPSIIGLPMRSVPGVTVIETAEFGRNVVTDDHSSPGNRTVRLGEIMYMGKKDSSIVKLHVNSLAMHTFICGAPGSGKSNTVYKLIYELCRLQAKPERDDGYGNVSFLVIEPAKGEYKYEFGRMPNVNIYTTKSGLCGMLCINPFAFPYERMDVTEHIERLKNIMSACWPLTAAMPSFLSAALEQSYVNCGWDIVNSLYVMPGEVRFPGFEDVLAALVNIIEKSDYSNQAKGDYKGALLTRVEALTRGVAGAVFSNIGTIPDSKLFDENTIIDLSMVGSSEMRSLIMGILVMKLENYRRSTATRSNYPLRHVTILEEAHNLLPRCSTAQSDDSSNVQGKSVEAVSNAISEMRTYGEGFIIVDQSPSAVADVAVSNTSTKIVMRLPGQDDVKAAGASIGLTEDQMRQIPMLPQGQAIVKQGNWIAPVMALIDKAPASYSTKKLREYEYDDLKLFRAAFIEKIYQVVSRNRNRPVFAAADRANVVKYLEKQTNISPDHIAKYTAYWNKFCMLSNYQRSRQLNRLIVQILSFEQALSMLVPPIPTGDNYSFQEAEQWCDIIEEVLDSYITADDDIKADVLCAVMKYCRSYSGSARTRRCAQLVIDHYGLDN